MIEALQQRDIEQARYYRALASELEQKAGPKSVGRWLSDNATILAAMASLVTLVVNYRAGLRNQADTQFYEALKRCGDRDSPTIRAGAVTLLQSMALSAVPITRGKPSASVQPWRQTRYPRWLRFIFESEAASFRVSYFEAAFLQLVAGLEVESDLTVLQSIHYTLVPMVEALRHVNREIPSGYQEKLNVTKFNLERRRIEALAECVALHTKEEEREVRSAVGWYLQRFGFHYGELELKFGASDSTWPFILQAVRHRLRIELSDQDRASRIGSARHDAFVAVVRFQHCSQLPGQGAKPSSADGSD